MLGCVRFRSHIDVVFALLFFVIGGSLMAFLSSLWELRPTKLTEEEFFGSNGRLLAKYDEFQDAMCSSMTNICYAIVDVHEANGYKRRDLLQRDFGGHVLTSIRFKDGNVDVSSAQLVAPHVRACVLGAKLTGAIGVEDDIRRSVLVLGLGGGALPTHFNEFNPPPKVSVVDRDMLMNVLARKWFQLPFSTYVYLSDAVKFVRDRARKELHDVVIVDVADAPKDGIVAPIPAFLDPSNIDLLCQHLKPYGTLVVHVAPAVPTEPVDIEFLRSVSRRYHVHFEHCFHLEALGHFAIVCSNGPVRLENQADFVRTLQTIPDAQDLVRNVEFFSL